DFYFLLLFPVPGPEYPVFVCFGLYAFLEFFRLSVLFPAVWNECVLLFLLPSYHFHLHQLTLLISLNTDCTAPLTPLTVVYRLLFFPVGYSDAHPVRPV